LAASGRITSVPDIVLEGIAELGTAPGEVAGNLMREARPAAGPVELPAATEAVIDRSDDELPGDLVLAPDVPLDSVPEASPAPEAVAPTAPPVEAAPEAPAVQVVPEDDTLTPAPAPPESVPEGGGTVAPVEVPAQEGNVEAVAPSESKRDYDAVEWETALTRAKETGLTVEIEMDGEQSIQTLTGDKARRALKKQRGTLSALTALLDCLTR
jgi:hypothetical protein